MWRKIITALIVIGCGALFVMSIVHSYQEHARQQAEERALEQQRQELYQKAVSEIKNEKYETAREYLEELPDDYEQKEPLLIYVSYCEKVAEGETDIDVLYSIVADIPKDYSGPLADELRTSRAMVEEKIVAQIQKEQEEEWKERARKMKDKIPYIGMSESLIDCTMVGAYAEVDRGYTNNRNFRQTKNKYVWRTGGGSIPLIVTCIGGSVSDVTKYYTDFYWNGDKPNLSNWRISRPSFGTSSDSPQLDPYDVYDYDDPDEFADEWADEFGDGDFDEGYEDAYNYWEDMRNQ